MLPYLFQFCLKQGIMDEGVLLVARGKELYRCNEMKEVKMTLDDLLKAELYNKRGARVASQTYKKEDFDRVKAFFKEKNIVTELVNQE